MTRRSLRIASLTSAAVVGLSLVGPLPADADGNADSAGGTSSAPAETTASPKVIAGGLDNPRLLSFTRSGDLLVAEAGEGGSAPCMAGPEGGEVCFGRTGAITKIPAKGRQRHGTQAFGKQSRIITGLPSLGGKGTGAQATGPGDVQAVGGRISVLIGLGGKPELRAKLHAAGRQLGTLIQTTRNSHTYRTVADLAAWEAKHNPVDDVDSNPTGMLYEHGRYAVTDAGGNTLLRVGKDGRIRLTAAFKTRKIDAPPVMKLPKGTKIPLQSVPTSVATRGHDGALYVSELTGFPFPKAASHIYRVDPRTGRTSVYASGLTNVTDLAFHGRTLYAVQLADNGLLGGPTGSVVRIKPGSGTHTVVADKLFAPYGIAIKGGHAYVTVGSVAKNVGQVIEIRL